MASEPQQAAARRPQGAPQLTLQKIAKTTGKQHQKEINQLVNGNKPIETGG
ncbi:MAG: hypothetical protein ACRDK2_16665 [Solirubrobacteraceae bacterium]